MRLVLRSDIDARVQAFTGRQFGVSFCDDGALLVNLSTGERIPLTESVPVDTPPTEVDGPTPALSKRERQVLEMIGDGVGTSEIAARLGLSQKTVETYRARIKQKLDIAESLKLIRYAVEWRLKQPSSNGQAHADHAHANQTSTANHG